MIEYKFDTKDRYIKKIRELLTKHNLEYVPEKEKESYYFYAIQNDNLVGALSVYYSWDWVIILDLFYDDVVILKDMVSALYRRYHKKAYGVHHETYNKNRLNNFLELGFEHCATIKSSAGFNDLYFTDLTNLDVTHVTSCNVISQTEQNIEYAKIMESKNKNLNIKLSQPLDDLVIIALDEDTFAGGIVVKPNEESFHISLLVVPIAYRGQNIGRKLMELAEEEAKKRSVFKMDLSTAEFHAKSFYEKLGYQVVYTRKQYPMGYENYKLVKHISK